MQSVFFQSAEAIHFQGMLIQENNQAALINHWFYLNNIEFAISKLGKKQKNKAENNLKSCVIVQIDCF